MSPSYCSSTPRGQRMDSQGQRAILISDFNVETFRRYLNNDCGRPRLTATAAPFGQVIPMITQELREPWQKNPEVAIVWTKPGSVIPSFNRITSHTDTNVDEVLREVDQYGETL